VVPPQPVIVYQEPPEQVFVVRRPPPTIVVNEVRPRSPGHGHVYIAGRWAVAGGRWVWINGHWARPPRARAVWVPARWEPRGESYHFSAGFWR
jgi:hypothetical protein